MARQFHPPIEVAKSLRVQFEQNVAKTWPQYFEQAQHRGVWLTAYNATLMVQEQCNCPFREAARAVEQVFPELYAEFWNDLP